jgi:hypothetical protein
MKTPNRFMADTIEVMGSIQALQHTAGGTTASQVRSVKSPRRCWAMSFAYRGRLDASLSPETQRPA